MTLPAFVCDVCNSIDNTALGHYWCRNILNFKDQSLKGRALCSECAPTKWSDGSSTKWGKWHDRFPKKQWDGKRKMINR